MKTLLLIFCWIAVSQFSIAQNSLYKYENVPQTGLQNVIEINGGKKVYIKFSPSSNKKVLKQLDKLLSMEGIRGSCFKYNKMKFDQTISIKGVLEKEVHRTEKGEHIAEPQNFHYFELKSIEIKFPFSRKVHSGIFDKPIVETYFSLDVLNWKMEQ